MMEQSRVIILYQGSIREYTQKFFFFFKSLILECLSIGHGTHNDLATFYLRIVIIINNNNHTYSSQYTGVYRFSCPHMYSL